MQDPQTFRAMVLDYLDRHPQGQTVRAIATATESSYDRVLSLLRRLERDDFAHRGYSLSPQLWFRDAPRPGGGA